MESSVNLNFINRSNDQNNSRIVIFQKPTPTSFDHATIAWLVIQNCQPGNYHPFVFEYPLEVSAGDSWGNFTMPLQAYPGDRFHMTKDHTGDVLKKTNEGSVNPSAVEVLNNLDRGSISVNVYRSGHLLAQKNTIAPSQKAVFDFKPSIFIGVAANIDQGTVIDSAVLAQINTELYLTGIISADIVMTGGGQGTHATPFEFRLENVRMA